MAPNHSWDPIGSILGPVGSHWVHKMGQNHKKLPCCKIRIFDYPAVIHFPQKMEVMVMAPYYDGEPLGSIFGPIGSVGSKKWVKTGKKLPCPKIRIFDYPAFNDFSQKMEFTVLPPNHGGDTLGAILGPMGSHWVKKMGQNVKNYHAPKFAVIDFSKKKWKLRLWRQITVGTP